MRWLLDRINLWVLLGALIVAGALIGIVIGLIYFTPTPTQPESRAAMTVIPGPTPTATAPMVTPSPTPTHPVSVGGITVGDYVKITGTEGAGLRLRSGPGTAKSLNFVGMDEEVFQVKDGPTDADGFTWWYLQAPYDPGRSGWAASQYLTVVQSPPTATP